MERRRLEEEAKGGVLHGQRLPQAHVEGEGEEEEEEEMLDPQRHSEEPGRGNGNGGVGLVFVKACMH